MRVDILGPLRVTCDGEAVASPMAKERALLEALALQPGRTVPLGELESALWGDVPPATAERSLQAHVARLRHDLGPEVVRHDPGGYRLDLAPEEVDAAQGELLVAAGEAAWQEGEPAAAHDWFHRAEVLWRGEPLVDLADTPERAAHVDRLAELHQRAQEGRIRADLALGRHREVLAELQRLAVEQPTREPLFTLLMLAQYRSGSPLDALRSYRRLRHELVDHWGVEPSAELQHLQAQVLRQDPQLDLEPPPPPFRVPAPTSRLVGRAGQVEAVAAAMARSRLVTLHGPAGVGKSRVAVGVAELVRGRYPEGIWWVDLTSCRDGDCVSRRIAEALGIPATPGPPLVDWVGSCLGPRRLMLVLDNCEQVATQVAAVLDTLLAVAPRLRLVATSRVRLGLPGEVVWEVPPLEVPADDVDEAGLLDCDSAVLFLDRLGQSTDQPDAALVARLCRALDGIPLALELIAARASHVTLAELVGRLPEELGRATPTTGRPAHHASVMQAIEWSYAALPQDGRRLLEWLSVAPADLDLACVRSLAVGAGLAADRVEEGLAQLVDASLVRLDAHQEQARYRLLFVIREFAAGRLREHRQTHRAEQAFADHFRDMCARAGPELEGGSCGPWLGRLHREMINVRAAVSWSLGHDPPPRTLQFARAMGRVSWWASTDLAADAELLRGMVARADDAAPVARGWGWVSVVTDAYLGGDLSAALDACRRAEELFEQAGDQRGAAVLHWHWGAALLLAAGDVAGADQHLREGRALALRTGATTAEAWCLAHLVQLGYFAGRVTAESDEFQARAEDLADPADAQLQSHLRMNRSGLHLTRGEFADAERAARDTEAYTQGGGIRIYEQAALLMLGKAQLGLGEIDAARLTSLRAARLALDMGNVMQLGVALLNLAEAEDLRGHATRAARLYGAGASRAPLWPGFWAAGFPEHARRALGSAFEDDAAGGARLSAEDALELAIG